MTLTQRAATTQRKLLNKLHWWLEMKQVKRILRKDPVFQEWADIIGGLPWAEILTPDPEGWTYVSPQPDFIDPDDKEGMVEFRRRYEWALQTGLIEKREAKHGVQTRIIDPNWWHRAAEALYSKGGSGSPAPMPVNCD